MIRKLIVISAAVAMLSATIPPADAADTFRFEAATLNIKADLNTAEAVADTRKAINQNPDAIGFQEIGGEFQADAMKDVLNANGYDFRRMLNRPAQAVPVAWKDSKWNLVDSFAWFLSDRTFVRVPGAGSRYLEAKEAMVVVLKSTIGNGKVVYINAHLCPEPELNRERNDLHAAQVERLAKLVVHVRSLYPGAEIAMVGDLNTPERWRFDPIVDKNLTLADNINTHPNGALDHVLSTMRPQEPTTIGNLNTDHKLLLVGLVGQK